MIQINVEWAFFSGIDLPFLHMYGVGDQPPYDEDEKMRMLILKDEEIDQLKQEITRFQSNRCF